MRRYHAGTIGFAALVLTAILFSGSAPALANPDRGLPTHDDTPVVLKIPATKEDRDRVRAELAKAERALPKPPSPFRLAPEGEERGVGTEVGKLDAPGTWNPVQAWLSRTYETRTASEEDDRTLEINLALNGARGLSSGLASVGGEARIVPMEEALAVRQTIIGAEEGSRVALPVGPEEANRALTLLRIYIVEPDLEAHLRRAVEGTGDLPVLDDTHVAAPGPHAIAAIVVEIRGERRDVETLAPKLDVKALRSILCP